MCVPVSQSVRCVRTVSHAPETLVPMSPAKRAVRGSRQSASPSTRPARRQACRTLRRRRRPAPRKIVRLRPAGSGTRSVPGRHCHDRKKFGPPPARGCDPPPKAGGADLLCGVVQDVTQADEGNLRSPPASRSRSRSNGDARSRTSKRTTSTLPQGLGRLNTQRSARRCGAREHTHRRHDDGRDH